MRFIIVNEEIFWNSILMLFCRLEVKVLLLLTRCKLDMDIFPLIS